MHPVKSHVPESSCEVNIADVFRAHLAKIDAMIRECEEAAGAPTSPAWCEVVEACMIVESMLEMLCMFLRYATVCSFGFHYSRIFQGCSIHGSSLPGMAHYAFRGKRWTIWLKW